MTDISEEKHRLLQLYAKKFCGIDDSANCPHASCSCAVAAEVRAFINKTIPEGYRKFSIKDFNGKIDDQNRLDSGIASKAKQQIFNYCWNDPSLLGKLSIASENDLLKASVIAKRYEEGRNVVIHGVSALKVEKLEDDKGNLITGIPLGRTFMASIIMKEAIKMKADLSYASLHFEWVQFSSLMNSLKNSDEESTHFYGCDWLVIDDITDGVFRASDAHKFFVESVIDPFFAHRLKSKLPTIFVFKFDVRQRETAIEAALGVTLHKIIMDKNTCLISLTEMEKVVGRNV